MPEKYDELVLIVDRNNEIVDLNHTEREYLIYNREFKNKDVIHTSNKCVIYGHTPTFYINNKYNIIKYNRKKISIERNSSYSGKTL